ncbi:MAG: metalloregulator ArsR/SmtB family transcription factor [Parvularculaceae bacterium]
MNARLDAALSALADPHRRRAVELLSEGPLRAGELAEALAITPPALSRHLREMKKAGLIEETHPEFDARVRVYALKAGAMDELKIWLSRAETMWTEQLSNLSAHIANKKK